MNDEKKTGFQQRLQALHDKYHKQLPEKLAEIHRSWDAWQADPENPERLEEFYRLIHTLKGTAATFGFNTQSGCCFEIQQVLLRIKEKTITLTEEDISTIQQHLDELEQNISHPTDSEL